MTAVQRALLLLLLAEVLVVPRPASSQSAAARRQPASRGGASAPAGGLVEQARRGKKQFVKSCVMCHAEDLTGRDPAPPLTGAHFMKKWDGKNVWDLFDKIRTTMPQEDKGSLSVKTYLDITAFILKFDGIDAGVGELKNDPDTLKAVVIKKGAAKAPGAP